MIELDLKGAGWPGRALAAVACHHQWQSIRRGSGFTSHVFRALEMASRAEPPRFEPPRFEPCG
jgi:hypothetical protein